MTDSAQTLPENKLIATYLRRVAVVFAASQRSNRMEREFLDKKILNAEANAALEDYQRERASFGEWLLQVHEQLFLASALAGVRAATVMGYAVVRTDGTFVGIWRELDIAEKIVNRGRQSKDERVVPMFSLSNNAAVAQPDGVDASASEQGNERQLSKLEDAGENPADGTTNAAPQATVSPRGDVGSNSVNDPSPAGAAPTQFQQMVQEVFAPTETIGGESHNPADIRTGQRSVTGNEHASEQTRAPEHIPTDHARRLDEATRESWETFAVDQLRERAQAAESSAKELEEALREASSIFRRSLHVGLLRCESETWLTWAQALLAAREGIESQSRRGSKC